MRRQVLFVGLICVAFLVNAQEEKTIDLDEVTIQASSIIRKKDRQLIFPSKDQMQRSMDGLDLTRRMSLPRLWVDPNTKSISMANGNVLPTTFTISILLYLFYQLFNDVLLFFFTNITIAKQGMFLITHQIYQFANKQKKRSV